MARAARRECQLAAHLGYEPDDNDRGDMTRLAEYCELLLPIPLPSGLTARRRFGIRERSRVEVEVWPIVHTELAALIDDLAGLTDEQWAHPSLCGDWTVNDVAAHLVNNAKTTRLGLMHNMVRARFDFDRQNAHSVERGRGATPHETLARLRQVATRTSTPPAPLDSRVVGEVVSVG